MNDKIKISTDTVPAIGRLMDVIKEKAAQMANDVDPEQEFHVSVDWKTGEVEIHRMEPGTGLTEMEAAAKAKAFNPEDVVDMPWADWCFAFAEAGAMGTDKAFRDDVVNVINAFIEKVKREL